MRVGNKIGEGKKENLGGKWEGMDHEDSAHTNPRFGKSCRNAGAGKKERERRKGEQVGGPKSLDESGGASLSSQ